MLHQQLVPTGAQIAESNLVEEPLTKVLREADITIDYEIAGYHIRIVIECRDRSRRATVEWIDQLVGKYGREVAKVVAVSRSGFTPAAIALAKAYGIETVSANEAVTIDWQNWVDDVSAITITLQGLELVDVPTVNLVDKSIKPEDTPTTLLKNVLFLSPPDFKAETAFQIYDVAIRRREVSEGVQGKPPESDGLIKWGLRLRPGTVAVMPDGTQHAVEGIIYKIRYRNETISVPLRALRVGKLDVAFGSAEGSSFAGTILLTRGEDGQPKQSLRLDSKEGSFPPGRYELFGSDPLPAVSTAARGHSDVV